MRNNILTLITVLLLSLAGTEVSASGVPRNAESKTGYAPIHDMQIYYEIYGQGKPMVLLHGGITAFEGWGTNIHALAKSRQVIAVHLQGHGNTADIDRPYRIEALADDVAALVEYLKLGKIDVAGYSLGGGVALQTAIRHPEVVDHLVVISSAMAQTGFYPEGVAAFAQMSKNAPMLADSVKKSPLATMYPKTNWETSFKKMGELASTPFDWSAQVKALKEPTLLVFADADAVRAEHIVEFYKALGGAQRDAGLDGSMRSMAQLAILPGTTHYNIIASPSLAVVIGEFLRR